MLVSLTVHNIALIETLSLSLHPGMNVFSGETGAGKSMIVDSINLVLGERADHGLIRSGCDKASIEALFDISDCPAAQKELSEMQIDTDGHLISLYREITAAGRNICRICGVLVPLMALRQLSSLLVDVHGQHEHQRLLDPKNHIAFLDAFGDAAFQQQKDKVAASHAEWKKTSSFYASLRKENARKAERDEYLKNKIRELDDAAIEPGEADRLSAERDRYAGAEKINRGLSEAYMQVLGGGREASVTVKLKTALDALSAIEQYDETFKKLRERLSSVYYETEEIGIEVRDQLERESFDPDRFEEIQARLDQIRKLEKRYGMSADELVQFHSSLKEEQLHLSGMEDRLKKAETDYRIKLRQYRDDAAVLTQMRQRLAALLEAEMEAQLADLGMNRTRFSCVFERPEDDRRVLPSSIGDDNVVFYISPNPGEPLKPLDQTASGGELSRLMLAFKAAAAERDSIPCMIFDEIDTGISGQVAGVVAEKMAAIAKYHQVLCITHLAQIAAIADQEILVHKEVVGERTYSHAVLIEGEDRVKEIARLIGVTEESQQSGFAHAREILEQAEQKRLSIER